MALTRPTLILLATASLILAGCHITPPAAAPSLGELEHRGRRYALRDLVDPAYRAASDDPFLRDFAPETVLARYDAPKPFGRLPFSAAIDARR